MRTAAWVGFAILNVACLLLAVWWRERYRRTRRALDEWRLRWAQAPELCAVPGCHQLPLADCHVESDFDEATTKRWGKHRYAAGRLVPVPVLLPREGLGRD